VQTEPEEIPFDYEKWKTGEWHVYLGDTRVWLISRDNLSEYTMRAKQ